MLHAISRVSTNLALPSRLRHVAPLSVRCKAALSPDTGETSDALKALAAMVGRTGVSRLLLKNGPGGYEALTGFMASNTPSEKQVLHAQDSTDEMQALHVWNVKGTKIYSYAGLGTVNEFNKTTAVGVLMLDRYAIQERVGDPASPFTWWPYQAFYAIPKGVDFAMCKQVGSAGAEAAKVHPEETKTVCEALNALVEVAISEGKPRIFITGDCGYYALAVASYCPILESMGWARKADACFGAPSFRVQDKIDVFLCLGTTQMISTPDPKQNISARLSESTCVYGTADLRGWYGGDALDQLNSKYPTEERMAGILRCNEGIMWGQMLAMCNDQQDVKVWQDVGEILVEFVDGSAHFLLGMYIGAKSFPADCNDDVIWDHWNQLPKNGFAHLKALKEDLGEMREFLRPGCFACCKKGVREGYWRKGQGVDPDAMQMADMTDAEMLAALVYMMGVRGGEVDEHRSEQWQKFEARMRSAIDSLIAFDEGEYSPGDQSDELTIGPRYIKWYCGFNLALNTTICKTAYKNGQVGHAIDGENVFLLDCKFVPGFGKQVADGLTVWSYSPFYFWLSFVYAAFVTEIREKVVDKPVIYHLECTELFSFTNFLQQNGVCVVDNPNYMYLASLSTDEPLQYARYMGDKAPGALLFFGDKWYRDSDIKLRTPEHDKDHYMAHKHFIFAEGSKGLAAMEWDKCDKAAPMFSANHVAYGGEGLYVGSTELVKEYVGSPSKYSPESLKGSIEYSGAE